MELFQTVIWIATLYGSLQAYPVCIKDDLKILEIIPNVSCEPDSTFYTPQNVEAKCITAALDCVMRELHAVEKECNDENEYLYQGIDGLKRMIDKRPDKDHALKSNDCQCEKWPTSNFTTFMENLNNLCELISSLS